MRRKDLQKYGILGKVLHKITLATTPLMGKTGISPNAFTSIGMLLSLVLLWALFSNQYILACVLIFLITALDLWDGDVARLKNQASAFGAFLDSYSDILFFLVVRIGIIRSDTDSLIVIGILAVNHLSEKLNDFLKRQNLPPSNLILRPAQGLVLLFNSVDSKLYLAILLVVAPQYISIWLIVDLSLRTLGLGVNTLRLLFLPKKSVV